MKVYTFSTSGCKDTIYLDRLVGNKDKVKDLIQDYLGSDFLVREVKFLLDKIEVNLYDIDTGFTEYKYYDLVSFEVD
jgi:hypothetical protein